MLTAAFRYVMILGAVLLATEAAALEISNRYRSPRNPERKVRRSTELIVLHTTEAPARSSLNKVSERGECHYCVTEEGNVYRIVDRDREAFHAGRSMWNGREDVDKFSVGIECVGHHDKPMSRPQIAAIAALVKTLKGMYHLSDAQVVCHSHVAYGAPNKWQKRNHRGRKRCGMLFAMPSMRRALGLASRPAYDPDTRAHRLAIGDPYLNTVLYGSVDTMIGRCGTGPAVGDSGGSGGGMGWFKRLFGKTTPKPTAPKAKSVAKPAAKPVVKPVAKPVANAGGAPASVADLKSRGFVKRGTISKGVTAVKIAGAKWNAPTTYYVTGGKVVPGNRIDPSHLGAGATVWMK